MQDMIRTTVIDCGTIYPDLTGAEQDKGSSLLPMFTSLRVLTELFEQSLKEARRAIHLLLINEVIAVVRYKTWEKKRKDLQKSPQACLLPYAVFYLLAHGCSLPPILEHLLLAQISNGPVSIFLQRSQALIKAEGELFICVTPCERKHSNYPRAIQPSYATFLIDRIKCCLDLVHHQLGRGQDVIKCLSGVEPGMVQHTFNGQPFLRFDLQQPGRGISQSIKRSLLIYNVLLCLGSEHLAISKHQRGQKRNSP